MSGDTLSDVLRAVRLRGAVFYYIDGSRPWVAEAPPAREIIPAIMPGAEHMIEFHGVIEGSCWGGDRRRATDSPGGAATSSSSRRAIPTSCRAPRD